MDNEERSESQETGCLARSRKSKRIEAGLRRREEEEEL